MRNLALYTHNPDNTRLGDIANGNLIIFAKLKTRYYCMNLNDRDNPIANFYVVSFKPTGDKSNKLTTLERDGIVYYKNRYYINKVIPQRPIVGNKIFTNYIDIIKEFYLKYKFKAYNTYFGENK